MNKNFRFMSVAIVFVLCFTAVTFGQGTTGSIEGTVKDQAGAVVPGVNVTVISTGATTGFKSTATTDNDGYFQVSKVPPGTYTISTEKSGFKSSSIANVVVSLEKNTSLGIDLEVGGGDVTVDVNATDTIQVDLSDSKLTTNITSQVIDSLPKGTTFTSLLKTAPNVRAEPLAAGFQIDGASGAENVFVVDGQEVTNFRTGQLNTANNIPFDLISEVQIKSTGLDAQYGGATGGVISVVTAGGNNQWRGNIGISFIPGKLQGSQRPFLNRWSSPAGGNAGEFEYFKPFKAGGTSFFPTARFSGPIFKNKLWFSAAYAPQIIETDQRVDYYGSTVTPTNTRNPNGRFVRESINYNQNRKVEEALIRIDGQPTQKLRFNANFLWNPVIDKGALPANTEGLTGAPQCGNLVGTNCTLRDSAFLAQQGGRQNSNNVNGQVTWNPTNNLILNFRAGRTFLNEKLGAYGIPNATRYLCSTTNAGIPAAAGCSSGFTNFASNFQIAYDVSTRNTFDTDASLLFNGGGRHNLKFGYQFNRLSNTTDQGYKPNGVITLWYNLGIDNFLGSAPTGSGLRFDPAGNDLNPTGNCATRVVATDACNNGAGRIRRFGTIGAASSKNQALFAQDSWQIANRLTLNLGLRIENEDVPSFNSANKGIKFGWGDKLSPRLGASFDLTGDGKTKLFASYGWFYDRFKYELPRGSFGGDFFRDDYFEILPARGTAFASYTLGNILGSVTDRPGGNCPDVFPATPLPTLGNGYSVCQLDFRIPSNLTGGSILTSGAVDPNLKAARQSEYTVGVERQISSVMLFSARFSHKSVDRAIEDIGFPTASGSEAYIIGNPGYGLAAKTATDNGYIATKAERKYDALEFRIDKRLSNNYFFNASYTYSRLFGNYSGLASSDEAGRSSPNVNRFFDLPFLGYTANGKPDNGRLATDRPHVFKAFAGYNFDWSGSKTNSTDISVFTSVQSGTPLTTQYTFYNATAILYGRGDLGRTEMFTETDLLVTHSYKFGRDARFTFQPFLNIRNLFDEENELTRQTVISPTSFTSTQAIGVAGQEVQAIRRIFNGGIQTAIESYINASPATRKFNTYKLANGFQGPREVRFGFRMFF
jgi:Carboxypeptidase regulatory-like domain/TonB dependent receptor/TonB-dependent Receptor Plug Domain